MNAHGLWVFVCGPSGAGKDSVIGCARAALGDQSLVVFARRVVTRAAGPQGEHDEVSRTEFSRRRSAGDFAWHWAAHGHDYGIPRDYARLVDAGCIVVVNGSREHAGAIASSPSVRVALVTAPEATVNGRLLSRARDDVASIEERIARNASLESIRADFVIDNSGTLARAGAQLAHWLMALAHA